MDVYFKLLSVVILASILALTLAKQGTDFSLMLTLLVCSVVLTSSVQFLRPIFSFFTSLSDLLGDSADIMKLLMKIVGVGVVSQITEMVCNDAGNTSLGKVLHILTISVILWLSLPILEELVSLMKSILEAV